MTFVAENRVWLEPYTRTLQTAMKLDHWRITLEDEWPDGLDHSDAAAWRADDYNRAKLYIRDPDGDDHELRWRIVHEFVHLLMRDYDAAVDALEEHMNPPTWHLAKERFRHEMEQVVEAIAYAWAETLPLPVREESEATP